MSRSSQVRRYDPGVSVVFLKTSEPFGGLSNMAPGFPLRLNGIHIRTSEALYQACRFPHMPNVQRQIIGERSPMTAKMRSKPFRKDSRPDWDAVRVKIMRWCLRVKLVQNWKKFGDLLLATGERPIVEQSRNDDFWGAKITEDGLLVGMNVLGRLLMELREQMKTDAAESLKAVKPLSIPEFLLFRKPIEITCADEASAQPTEIGLWPAAPRHHESPQPTFFEQSIVPRGQLHLPNGRTARTNTDYGPKPYSGYRNSGLPWLCRLPDHWPLSRNKYLFREIDDRTDTGTETLLSMRQTLGLVPHEKVSTKPVTPGELIGYKRVRAGQLVLNRMQASNGMFAVARENGLVSPDYAVYCLLQPIVPDYFVNLFRTNIYRAKFRQESKGLGTGTSGFLRLYSDHFGSVSVPHPPEEEQAKIVAFVDSYDRFVRQLIRNKSDLLQTLHEQKQAIINQVVTSGLNPNTPMKSTGIDWMPEVPIHWEVKPLKHWLRQRANMLSDQTDPDYEFDYLDISCVGTGFLTTKPERIRFENAPSRARQIVEKGDTLISTVRTYLKAVYFVEDEWDDLIASTGFAVLRPVEAVQPKLLGYILQCSSFIERVIRNSLGVAYPAISELRLGKIHVGLPRDTGEQRGILDFIDSETASINHAIEKTQQEISLICEYRERLVSDAVTGKLDFREVEISGWGEAAVGAGGEDRKYSGEGDVTDMPANYDA